MNRGRWNGYSFWIDLQFYILVGDIPIPLNNIWKSLGMIIPNIWKNKKCSKPPTSIIQLDIGESDNAEQEKSWSRSSTEPTAVDVSWCMYLTWGPSIFCRSLVQFWSWNHPVNSPLAGRPCRTCHWSRTWRGTRCPGYHPLDRTWRSPGTLCNLGPIWTDVCLKNGSTWSWIQWS